MQFVRYGLEKTVESDNRKQMAAIQKSAFGKVDTGNLDYLRKMVAGQDADIRKLNEHIAKLSKRECELVMEVKILQKILNEALKS